MAGLDKEETISGIEAFRQIMLRAAGSKRVFSFFAWLLFVGYVRPAGELLYASVAVLFMLWLLLVRYPGGDANPVPAVTE